MPNAYTWQFEHLIVYPTYETVQNAVTQVQWRMHVDDGAGHTSSAYGIQQLGPIDTNDFIPFESLTQAVVQGWVEDAMGATELALVQAGLDMQITQIVNPPTQLLEPPWA